MKRVIDFLIKNPQYMDTLNEMQKKRNKVGDVSALEQCIYKEISEWVEWDFENPCFSTNNEDRKAFEKGLERLDYNTDTILYRYSFPLVERYKKWGNPCYWFSNEEGKND